MILCKNGYKVMINGDMNAWIGNAENGIPGNDHRINLNGERLLNFLERMNMVHINGTEKCTGMGSENIDSK